ncbi:MAG: L-asparagine permease [Nonomuraea muscovyensis]|nr:L-asparagine permease [Nonomuraea muscovyensis]
MSRPLQTERRQQQSEIVTLAFPASVLVPMWADERTGRITVMTLPAIAAALVAGWFLMRRRVSVVRDVAESKRAEGEN